MNQHDLLKMITSPKEWESEQQQKRALDLQHRQTIASEKAVQEAKKANALSNNANKIAEKAVKKSNCSLIVSILFGILSTIISIIALCK